MVIEEEYVPSPLCKLDDPTHTMDEELKILIAQQLGERTSYRKKRDYTMADKILENLMDQYSIVVDDRTKEWKVILGDDFEDDDFVKGALLSQRSAFVRGGKKTTKEDKNSNSKDKEEVIPSANEETLDFDSMTVPELKAQLRLACLPVSGKKAELITRLRNAS